MFVVGANPEIVSSIFHSLIAGHSNLSLKVSLFRHCKEFNVLGIDCKWKKNKKNTFGDSIALLQLTSHRGLCAIIPLYQLQEIPPELKVIT